MRGRILAGVILVLGVLAPAPPAEATCEGEECGVPSCHPANLRVRPGMPRALYVTCERAVGVKLVSGPAHGTISDLRREWSTIRFTVTAAADAPRHDEIVLEVAGEWKTIQQSFPIEVKPLSENEPPTCYGAEVSKRSAGDGPVEVYMNPWCGDPDGDELTATGTGPGVHLHTPVEIASNHTLSSWWYRTATHAGSETTLLRATDVLGASSEVELHVTVGPGVDRLAACGVNNVNTDEGTYVIHARPGAVRRFGISCGDPDGDPFVMTPSVAPSRGAFTPVLGMTGTDGFSWQQYDTTYVPADDSMEPDEFAVTATGTHGSQQARMRIVPRALPENGGGWCNWGGMYTFENVPTESVVECIDEEGDELSIEVLEAPRHGIAGPPVVTPWLYGHTRITIPYVPQPGFAGYDCLKVRVTDGNGLEQTMLLEVDVQRLVEAPLPVPELPLTPPPLPLPDLPLRPIAPPGAPAPPAAAIDAMVRTYAEQALDAPSVRKLPSTGDAHVWAPATLSKAELLRDGVEPALVVICPRGCRLRSRAELFSGSRARARASRRRSAHQLAPGAAHLLWTTVARDQRRALRRASRAHAAFTLALRPNEAAPRSLERRIPFGR